MNELKCALKIRNTNITNINDTIPNITVYLLTIGNVFM